MGGFAVAGQRFPSTTADTERTLQALRYFGFERGVDAAWALATPGKALRPG